MSLFSKIKRAGCGRWTEKGKAHDCTVTEPTEFFENWGWADALCGQTTCPFGKGERSYVRWHRGYDKAEAAGLAKLTRFRDLRR